MHKLYDSFRNNNNNNNNNNNKTFSRLAVPAFLDFSLAFNPRDLYYRGYKK